MQTEEQGRPGNKATFVVQQLLSQIQERVDHLDLVFQASFFSENKEVS